MRVTPVPHGLDLTLSGLVRSRGRHASELYGSLYRYLDPKRYRREEAPNPLLLALGTAWENHLEFLINQNGLNVVRPGELVTTDGTEVAYSPDGILVDDERLVEYKLSSMGTKGLPKSPTNNLPPKFDKYLSQCKTYCYHLGTNKARLYFCSINKPHAPELLMFDIEFTDRELREEWELLVRHGRQEGLL